MKPGKKRWGALRYRQKIRNALLAYYLTPILLILFASGGFFYYFAKSSLEAEMGQRLIAIARSAAYQVRGFQVAALELRDPESLTHAALLARFDQIRNDQHVERVYLFNAGNESLLDTERSAPLGSTYERHRFQRAEMEEIRRGKPAASLLFQGADGTYFKSAFVPVLEEGQVVAFVGVDASATFFESLRKLGRRLALFGLACVGLITLVSVMISRKIVTPVQHLVEGAQRIGEGVLDEPIELRTQNEIGFLGFVLDEMRKNIVARDRELKTMLQGIAHEVRNPLGGIELFAGMLEEGAHDEEERRAVHRIKEEVRTLKNLIEEFLDFARGATLQMTPVKLPEFFDDVRVAYLKEMEEHGIRFRLNHDGVETAEFDPDQMRRVFLNLVRNSIQAMPKGGTIEIKTAAENGQIEIAVSDDGVGIDPKTLESIFDPFFTTKEKGTGLGLSFVRKIVNAHGGEVRVASTKNVGTTVSVLLPR